tara:strand:+ start:5580 stop:6683 length:1104 start_codon:yes stop_codon:yes gene_type:complete
MFEKKYYWLALNMVPGIGRKLYHRLINHFHSPEKVFQAPNSQLLQIEGMGENLVKAITSFKLDEVIEREKKLVELNRASILTFQDNIYPENLKKIYDPPPVLYMKGSIAKMDNVAVAIVGTRIPSRYGKLVTEKISAELAKRGVTIISGMASGIDSIAHRSAIAARGRTLAVFGCGVNMTYPTENINLKEMIIENGAVLSEFPMNTRPERTNFPMRNRIISGLSLGTIVIEAAEKSGALITSDFALEQGKDVFAVPGNINSPKSKGTNRLIKMGAKLVESADDIIEEFPYEVKMLLQTVSKQKEKTDLPELSVDEKKIYSLLSEEETHIDTLIQESNMPSQKVSALLIQMELKDVIKQQSGKMFVIA